MFLSRSVKRPAYGWRKLVNRVLRQEKSFQKLDDAELRKHSLSLAYRTRSGEALEKLLTAAFALVREASRRQLGMQHFPVQLLGGVTLHFGGVAEMQTGEGKTLTASLPLYLNALAGHGAALGDRERLFGPPGCGIAEAGLRIVGPERGDHSNQHAPRGQATGLCLRHHLRNCEGVRVRFFERPPVGTPAGRWRPRSSGANAGTAPELRGDGSTAATPALVCLGG